jgi:hypothetical protein
VEVVALIRRVSMTRRKKTSERFLKQRNNIKFCVKLGKNASDICEMFSETTGFSTMTKFEPQAFVVKKSTTEIEHPSYSTDLVPNDFWLFPKIKSALKGRRYEDTEDMGKKKCKGPEIYSTVGVPKIFPTTAASLG